jgi:phospho-N-acetylmuramoyl-pentapeptide-transferase
MNKLTYSSNLGIVLLVFIGYACIGFLDDFLSIRRGNNEGLTAYQKLFMQVLIAIGFFYIYMRSGGQTAWVVGTLRIDIELGWLYGLAILFVLVGASNAVNLTDGLDGLAGGLSAIAFIAFSLISLSVGFEDIGIFSLILVGSLMGFLIYNSHHDKVIMGDTGFLGLGALM